MKSLFLYFVSLLAILCCTLSCKTNTTVEAYTDTFGFASDSGYVTVGNLHKTLIITPDDTLFKMYEDWKVTDTIGKYYKMANGNYIASVASLGSYKQETIKLCEATQNGEILKAEEYRFGNYRCCWDNIDDCLKKFGDYYIFTSCGTGSGFCGGDIYLFKNIKPQHWQESIPESIWMWAGPDMQDHYISITSKMEMKNDTVIMHYTNQLYEQLEDSETKTTKSLEKFDITWIQKNDNWVVTDSLKLKEIIQYR